MEIILYLYRRKPLKRIDMALHRLPQQEQEGLIARNLQTIVALCERYKVNKLFAFGSVLTPRFNDSSDIDLTVDFNKTEISDYFDNYFDFKYALEDVFGREVDLVEEQTIRNPYLKQTIESTKRLIYG
jgi:predicted nucleotidyltransferase